MTLIGKNQTIHHKGHEGTQREQFQDEGAALLF
jgi:hypothetical protein